MNEVLTVIGKYSVYTSSFFVVIAYLWYSFVVYKKGLEYRYSAESLLDLAVISGVFGWIGSRLVYVLTHVSIFQENWLRVFLISAYPGYDYFGLLIGLALAGIWVAKRGEFKLYEGLDLIGLGLPASMAFERLGRVLSGKTQLVFGVPLEIFQAFMFLLIFVWLWKLEPEFRTFDWYRFRKTQAKSGFIFGAFLFLSGLAIVATHIWPNLSGSVVLFGLASMMIGVIVVYHQSGRNLGYDVKLLPLVRRWYTKSK